jgi:hypothetical protein
MPIPSPPGLAAAGDGVDPISTVLELDELQELQATSGRPEEESIVDAPTVDRWSENHIGC